MSAEVRNECLPTAGLKLRISLLCLCVPTYSTPFVCPFILLFALLSFGEIEFHCDVCSTLHPPTFCYVKAFVYSRQQVSNFREWRCSIHRLAEYEKAFLRTQLVYLYFPVSTRIQLPLFVENFHLLCTVSTRRMSSGCWYKQKCSSTVERVHRDRDRDNIPLKCCLCFLPFQMGHKIFWFMETEIRMTHRCSVTFSILLATFLGWRKSWIFCRLICI